MYYKTKIFAIIFFILIFQISFFPNLFPGRISPDALLIFFIILSIRENFEKIWIWLVFFGLFFDIISMEKIGAGAFPIFLISLSASFVMKRFFVSQKFVAFFAVAIIVLVGTIASYLLSNILNSATYLLDQEKNILPMVFDLKKISYKIINNLIFLIIFYWPIKKFLDNFKRNEKIILR